MGIGLSGQIPEGGRPRAEFFRGLLARVVGIDADAHNHQTVTYNFHQDPGQLFPGGENIVRPMEAKLDCGKPGVDRAQDCQSGGQSDQAGLKSGPRGVEGGEWPFFGGITGGMGTLSGRALEKPRPIR